MTLLFIRGVCTPILKCNAYRSSGVLVLFNFGMEHYVGCSIFFHGYNCPKKTFKTVKLDEDDNFGMNWNKFG